jgi:hypothetical protein
MTELYLPELTLLNGTPLAAQMTALTVICLPKNTCGLSSFGSSLSKLELIDIGVTSILTQNFNTSSYSKLKYLIARCSTQVVTPSKSPVFWSSSPLGKGDGVILVPASMVDAYKADENWSTYADCIESIEGNPELCG